MKTESINVKNISRRTYQVVFFEIRVTKSHSAADVGNPKTFLWSASHLV